MLSMEQLSVTVMGDTSRTLAEYARRTDRTLEQVIAEGLADWAETVAEPRLEIMENVVVSQGIHLVN